MKILISALPLILFHLLVRAQDNHFAGGSMSFKFVDTKDLPYKLKLTIITGWSLGQGPCGPACRIHDVGRSTNMTRNIMQRQHGTQYFGNWTVETKYTNGNVSYFHVTDFVESTIIGAVAAVNEPMKWEQEIAEVILNIDPAAVYTDISMLGSYWRRFDYRYSHDVHYHLQTKVHPHRRNDTGQPNRSPVAMFKPVYKVLLNSETTIKLSTMDKDDDIVLCNVASFIEAGSLKMIPNTTINKDCSILIKAYESDGFKDGYWGAIAMVVSDYNRHAIDIEGEGIRHKGDVHRSLSEVSVQFMIQTVRSTDAPEFVSPTEDSQHDFTVYVGSALQIPLYAKPKDDTSPTDSHDRNYKVEVKGMNVTKTNIQTSNGPYFTLLPWKSTVECKLNSTCSFPVYVATNKQGGRILSVKTTTTSLMSVKIGTPINDSAGDGSALTDVVIVPNEPGKQILCLEAEDNTGLTSEEECLVIDVDSPDPCDLAPCKVGQCNGGDGRDFTCICQVGFTGKLCETDIDECMSKPCFNGATCYETLSYGEIFCLCPSNFTGKHCQSSIQNVTVNTGETTIIVGYKNGATFRCMVDHVCTISLTVSKKTGSAPVMKIGAISEGLDAKVSDSEMKPTHIHGNGDLYCGELDIYPHDIGDKKICIQARRASSSFDRFKDASVCYHLHVDNGTVWNDKFISPTPPESSNIPCSPEEVCHIHLYTMPTENGSCIQVTTLRGSTANISVTSPDVSHGNCFTDVSVTLHAPTLLLCLESGKDIKARCFVLFLTPPMDPCERLSCLHSACIVERNGTGSCVCEDADVNCVAGGMSLFGAKLT